MKDRRDSPGRTLARPRAHERAKAMVAVLSVVALAVGGVIFLVAHPSGRAAFERFLSEASGKKAPDGSGSSSTSAPAVPARDETLPADVRAILDRARKAIEDGEFDAAEAACREALAKASDCGEAAELLESIGPRRARAQIRKQQIIHDAALEAARGLLTAGDIDGARERLDEALEQLPNSPKALALQMEIAEEKERREKELAGKRRRADDLAHEGTQALALGDAHRAIELARQALAIDPGNMAAKNLRAQAELAKTRATDVASAEPTPTPAGGQSKGQGEFEIGRICWQSGDIEGAEMYAKRALQADPAHGEAKELLAKAVETRRRLAAAGGGATLVAGPDDAAARKLADAERELAQLKERIRDEAVGKLKARLAALEADGRGGTDASREEALSEFERRLKAGQQEAEGTLAGGDTADEVARYVAQADEFRKAKMFDEARAAIEKAYRAAPRDVEVMVLMKQIEREAIRHEIEASKPAEPDEAAAEPVAVAEPASTEEVIGPDAVDLRVPDDASETGEGAAAEGATPTGVDLGREEGQAGPIDLDPGETGAAAVETVEAPPPAVEEGPVEVIAETGSGPEEIETALPGAPTEIESAAMPEPRAVEHAASPRPLATNAVELESPPVSGARGAPGRGSLPAAVPSSDLPRDAGRAVGSAPAFLPPTRTAAERVPELPRDLPAGVGEVLMALGELDASLEREDIGAFDRILSQRASGGAFSGGDVTRAEELANIREFYRIAEGIRVDRTTRPEDVKVGALDAEARSRYRITYRVGGQQVSRAYDAVYRFARERGAWRISRVVVQGESP